MHPLQSALVSNLYFISQLLFRRYGGNFLVQLLGRWQVRRRCWELICWAVSVARSCLVALLGRAGGRMMVRGRCGRSAVRFGAQGEAVMVWHPACLASQTASRVVCLLPLPSTRQADEFSGQMNPVGGLVYYISAPESLAAAAANPLHTLFYVAFMLGSEYAGQRVQRSVGYCKIATRCAARSNPLEGLQASFPFVGPAVIPRPAGPPPLPQSAPCSPSPGLRFLASPPTMLPSSCATSSTSWR